MNRPNLTLEPSSRIEAFRWWFTAAPAYPFSEMVHCKPLEVRGEEWFQCTSAGTIGRVSSPAQLYFRRGRWEYKIPLARLPKEVEAAAIEPVPFTFAQFVLAATLRSATFYSLLLSFLALFVFVKLQLHFAALQARDVFQTSGTCGPTCVKSILIGNSLVAFGAIELVGMTLIATFGLYWILKRESKYLQALTLATELVILFVLVAVGPQMILPNRFYETLQEKNQMIGFYWSKAFHSDVVSTARTPASDGKK